MTGSLSTRFLALLERHLSKLTIRGHKATGLCLFHPDRSPSFVADLEKCVWYCFPCGIGGGVKDFAILVGKKWNTSDKSHTAKVLRARFQAEKQARAILQRRADERDKELSAAYRDACATAISCAYLLTLFYQRSDLAEEFSDVVDQTESDYADALFQRSVLEAKLAGEVV